LKHTSQTPAAARSGQHSANLQMPAWPRSGLDPARLARSGPDLASAGQLPDRAAGGCRRLGLNHPSPPPSLPTRAAPPVDGPSPRRPRQTTAAARELEPPPPLTRLHLRGATSPSRSRPRRRGADRAAVPFAKHAALDNHYGPRRRHRTRGKREGPRCRQRPGFARRRRLTAARRREREGGELRAGRLGFLPVARGSDTGGRDFFPPADE
jgi:hypothetical protein